MAQKRSKLEIYLDVLKIIKKGTHKSTRIMYKANLSWKSLIKTLDSLIEQGLIFKEEGKQTTYHITENGRNILKYLEEATKLIKVY